MKGPRMPRIHTNGRALRKRLTLPSERVPFLVLQPRRCVDLAVAAGAGRSSGVDGIDQEVYEPGSNAYAARALAWLGIQEKLFYRHPGVRAAALGLVHQYRNGRGIAGKLTRAPKPLL